MALNWVRQPSRLPKSRSMAARSAPTDKSVAPRLSKYSSCRSIEFIAINSSRFKPLTRKPGAPAQSSSARRSPMALRRLTAPP
jgi:hypothetical protein